MIQHTVPTPYVVGEAHYYSTEIKGELVLFDTGPPTEDGLAALKRNVDLKRLKHVFITHCHVDHFGHAGYLEKHTDAQIYIPRRDAVKVCRSHERRAALVDILVEAGFDAEFAQVQRKISIESHLAAVPLERFHIVEESQEVLDHLGITYLSCPGHSQADTVYLLDGAAVTGDLLLREIFQNPVLEVDLKTFSGRYRNYAAYCSSLPALASLEGREIHPGHRDHVDGVRDTILFYVRKLLERAAKVRPYAHLEKPAEMISQIFGDGLDPFVKFMKVSEIFFMRDFLAEPELLRESLKEISLLDLLAELYGRAVD
ncbi:MBL fold metallo-hydrolase [Geomesophilobacter sediminis]|uniref:MBL fold metallo-hydrolase n=1 Tax=Geomesophilobacter sediminis TaxID=2798584 RepID=A0A8J7INX5_9BACT|nr:MBL fold metallo-hydrolase [Geomesophilobacter sediminis]MBJ6723889.1 MBL fold metallo-hydrolase [Geomesophilobacter sediminis]